MKVLMVYCNAMLQNTLPVGVTQLTSCLRRAGVEVDLFHTTFYKWGDISSAANRINSLQIRPFPFDQFTDDDLYKDFRKKIEESKPDLIGFSVVEATFLLGMKMLDSVSDQITEKGIKIAVGGAHTILAPHTVAKHKNVDFISISESENAFPELCKKLEAGEDTRNTRGFWVRDNGSWIKNPKADITDIKILPPLEFSDFGSEFLRKPMMGKMRNTVSIETTRGCPYRCTYCGDHALREIFREQGPWYREKTMDQIFPELDGYVKQYDPEFLYIISESFTTGRTKRLSEFCERYADYKIPFWFNTRPEDINDEKAKLVKEAGCVRISIGLEHGNEAFRRDVLNRKGSDEAILAGAQALHDYGVSFSVNVIIGFPDETRDMVFDSIRMVKRFKADSVSIGVFNPYYGTKLRDVCVDKGYIGADLISEDFFLPDYLLRNNTLSKEEVLGLLRTFPIYVELPESEWKRIEPAEKFTNEGNKVFEELKKEFYQLKGW